MTPPDAPSSVRYARRLDALALASVVLWAVAAWLTHRYGLWVSVGTTAILLGTAGSWLSGWRLAGAGRHGRGLMLGLAAGLAMAWMTALLYAPVTALVPVLRTDAALLYDAFSRPGIGLTLLFLPLIVTAEEVVWRGTVHASLEGRLSPLFTTLTGTVLYAAVLVPTGSPTLVLTALGAGACWTALRTLTGSIASAVAAHLVWDLLVLVVQVVPLG